MTLGLLVASLIAFIVAAISAFTDNVLEANVVGFVSLGLALWVGSVLSRDIR